MTGCMGRRALWIVVNAASRRGPGRKLWNGKKTLERALKALRALFAVAVMIASAAPSGAQAPALAEVALTPERVETVIAAFPQMRTRLEEMDAQFDSGAADDVASQLQALALLGSTQGALNSAAIGLGFADFLDWLATTNAVFMAHAFAKSPDMDAQMQQTLAQIDSQPGLSAEQKQQMKSAIHQSMGALQTMRPPEENIAAVEPYSAKIEAMLKE
jgi:hypothetical protein